MPIFEFLCLDCRTGRRFSALVGMVANASPPTCPHCSGANLQRCVSRFSRVRSEDEALDALADAADELDESDPKAMRRFVREMAAGMDDEMEPDELEALVEEETTGAGGADEGDSGEEDV